MKFKTIFLSLFALLSISNNTLKENENVKISYHTQAHQIKQLTKLQLEQPIHAQSIEKIRLKFLENKEIEGIYDLYDVNFQLSYYLILFKEKGYLIYNIEEKDYEEFSETSPCPFNDYLDKMLVYLCTGNYFYVQNDHLVSIIDNYEVNTNTELSYLRSTYTQLQDRKQEELLNDSTINSNGSENLFPEAADISQAFYFRNLHSNYCYNYLGSCGYISMQIILGFNNFCKGQGGLIPKEYVINSTQMTSSNIEECTDSPGSEYNFHYHLLEIGESLGINQGGINMTELDKIFKEYMKQNSKFTAELDTYYHSNLLWNIILRQVLANRDYPVIVHITGDDPDISPNRNVSHAAICYGYVDNGAGYRLHLADRASDITDVITKKYVINSFYCAYFTTSHKHAYGYIWDTLTATNKYCACGQNSPHYHTMNYEKVDKLQHIATCEECGNVYYTEHNYRKMQERIYLCFECGQSSTTNPYES